MSTFDGNNFYYSGQGVVMIGERTALGRPKGLLPVGNVSDLKIAVGTSVLEHKEAQTGQRAIDLRLTTETKCTLSMTMENYIAANLAIALRGDNTVKAAASVTNEATLLYFGKIMPLANMKVSTVVVTNGAVTLVAYTNDATPYDYKVNEDGGSIQFNDGQTVLCDAAADNGTSLTGITVGTTTTLTYAARPANAVVGGKALTTGLTGADAAFLNDKAFAITALTATTVVIDVDTTAKTITFGTGKTAVDGDAIAVDYAYAAQNKVDALVNGTEERYLRFEGLNTADSNNPVVIEVFKFSTDPLKELSMISDTVGQFVLEGNVLADPLQTTGSKFFKETLLR